MDTHRHIALTLVRQTGVQQTGKDDGEWGGLEGYASVFNLRDSQGDVILPGAFLKSLADWRRQGRFPALLWQHDPRQPVGVIVALQEDARGLYLKAQLALEAEAGREAHALVRAGALDGLSIGFRTVRAERDRDGTRRIQEVALWEVSLVTFPANPAARVVALKEALLGSVRRVAQSFKAASR
jgi:HK97 family phage prohead protease